MIQHWGPLKRTKAWPKEGKPQLGTEPLGRENWFRVWAWIGAPSGKPSSGAKLLASWFSAWGWRSDALPVICTLAVQQVLCGVGEGAVPAVVAVVVAFEGVHGSAEVVLLVVGEEVVEEAGGVSWVEFTGTVAWQNVSQPPVPPPMKGERSPIEAGPRVVAGSQPLVSNPGSAHDCDAGLVLVHFQLLPVPQGVPQMFQSAAIMGMGRVWPPQNGKLHTLLSASVAVLLACGTRDREEWNGPATVPVKADGKKFMSMGCPSTKAMKEQGEATWAVMPHTVPSGEDP